MLGKKAEISRVVGKVSLQIGNAGVGVAVLDTEHGPKVEIESGAFGNLMQQFGFFTDRVGLFNLGQLFMKASESTQRYAETYVHAARGDYPRSFGRPMAGNMECSPPDMEAGDLAEIKTELKKALD